MIDKKKTEELEKSIAQFYDRYSAKRVAFASLLMGVLSLLASLCVYAWLSSGFIAALAFFLVGFIVMNVAFLTIVPPASSLAKSKALISGALKEPARIKSYNMQKVQLEDSKGKVQTLAARELSVWKTLVVPYLIESQANGGQPEREKAPRKLTASERKYIEQRRKEVLEMEKKINDERKALDTDRQELEIRSQDLKQAEELVIARLTGVEQVEAELEQLKIVAAERADTDAAAYDAAAAKTKADELRAKERELADLKERLVEDRRSLESQKSELQRLQEAVMKAPNTNSSDSEAEGAQSLEAREAALEARQKALESAAQELDERANFVADSENSLIERLDALTEREANIEQSEVNAGLRQD